MSLNELLDLQRKPWCNIEVEDLYVDGTFHYHGALPNQVAPYIVGPTGFQFNSIQSAINAVGISGGTNQNPAVIYVYPGYYTENLTLYGGIKLVGLDNSVIDDINLAGLIQIYPLIYPYYSGVRVQGSHILYQTQTNGITNATTIDNITFISDISGIMFNTVQTSSPVEYPNTLAMVNCKIYCADSAVVFQGNIGNSPLISLNNCTIGPGLDSAFNSYQLIIFEGTTGSQRTIGYINANNTSIIMGQFILINNNNYFSFNFTKCILFISFFANNLNMPISVTISDSVLSGSFDGPFHNPIFNRSSFSYVKLSNCSDTSLPFVNPLTVPIFSDCNNVGAFYMYDCTYPGISDIDSGSSFGIFDIRNIIMQNITLTSDNLVFFTPGASVGQNNGSNIMNINGAIKKPTTPLAIFYNGNTSPSVTGDGTVVTVPFDTGIVDQTSSFNVSTYTYTFPVDGYYRISVTICLSNLSVNNTDSVWQITCSDVSKSALINVCNIGTIFGSDVSVPIISAYVINNSNMLFYSQGDTISVNGFVSGNPVANVFIHGGTGVIKQTYISIELVA